MNASDEPAAGPTRLAVLRHLPPRHQDYVFAEVRRMCADFISSCRLPRSERESATLELVSEVLAKLIGIAVENFPNGTASGCGFLSSVTPNGHPDPKQDGRVAWLLGAIGSRRALAHRYEDIRRRLHGRRTGGYRSIQLMDHHLAGATTDPADPCEEEDHHDIWRGLILVAGREFEPDDDALIVLQLIAKDPTIEAAWGATWPVRAIVSRLNDACPNRPWTDDRADNAKRRLQKWVERMKRRLGLDPTELRDFFARCARRHDADTEA